ncbi:MAG: hypothetical protein ACREPJ_09740 [Rhodanobacteraceae bacterium]
MPGTLPAISGGGAGTALTPLVVGVTSHRNLVASEVPGLRQEVRDFFAWLQQAFPGLPLWVLSPLAEGGDQLVAEEALAVGARVIAPLPFARSLYAGDFTDAATRARFEALCAQADVIELPLLPGNTVESIARPGAARERQYTQAGVFTASHSHILLALWDGRPSHRVGGTAQIVRFHMDGIAPGGEGARGPQRVTLETGDESLLYHIACSRQAEAGTVQPPAPPLTPLEAHWVTDDGPSAAAAGMPPEFRRVFQRMQQFNRDAASLREDSGAGAAAAPGEAPGAADPIPGGRLFAAADALAIRCQRHVLWAMRILYTLAVLMGLAYTYYSDTPPDVPDQGNTIYVFVVLFAAGGALAWLVRRRQWHRKYIDYRALAEGLRVQAYWRRAGIGTGESGAFAHANFMQKQDVELGWIRHVMRAAEVAAATSDSAVDLQGAIRDWVGEADGGGQLGYYARKAGQRHRTHARNERVAQVLLGGAVLLSALLAALHHWLDSNTATWMVGLMGALTFIAAGRESYAFHRADKELVKQYGYMRALFASARRQLDTTSDPDTRRAILQALGEAALAEHAQWALMHRQRPLEAGKL